MGAISSLTQGVGLYWQQFLWQLAAFIILLVILWRFLYRPILRVLDERANRVRNSMETAERVQREMAEMEERSREALEDARRQAQVIISQAQQAANNIQVNAQESAREQANQIVASAQDEIDKARVNAMEDLRRQVADLAISAASRVVRRELDPQTHYQLINDVLAETGTPPSSGNGGRPVA